MTALELSVYEIFKSKLGEKEVETIIEFIELKSKEKMNRDKLDVIKWMFGFWITLVLLILTNWFLKN